MRVRDVLIVAVGIVACIFGWLQEGSLSIKPGFVVRLLDGDVVLRIPERPIVTDLNGDGRPELLVAVQRDYLSLFETDVVHGNFQNQHVDMMAQRQVPLSSDMVGMGVGLLKRDANSSFVAVVTDDYHLTLFNHDLSVKWQRRIIKSSQAGIFLYHAAVVLRPERIFEHDTLGCVFVAVRIGAGNGTERTLFAAFSGDDGDVRWTHFTDPFVHGAAADGAAAGDQTTPTAAAVGDSLLMTERELEEHYNDLPWTFFREAIIGALPHEHSHQWHTRLVPHIFYHAKSRKKRSSRKGEGTAASDVNTYNTAAGGEQSAHRDEKPHRLDAAAQRVKAYGELRAAKYKDPRIQLDRDDIGELGERLGTTTAALLRARHNATRARRHANTLVFHGTDGVEVLHLYTGKRVTQLRPLRRHGTLYHDVNDDYHIDAISCQIGVASHLSGAHGVDIKHECLGVALSGAPVAEDPLYNATVCDTEGLFSGLTLLAGFLRGDGTDEAPVLDKLSLIGSHNVAESETQCAANAPVVVQRHRPEGVGLFRVERSAVFMIDTGLVTALDVARRRVAWRAQTEASFARVKRHHAEEVSNGLDSEEERLSRSVPYPHLARLALHTEGSGAGGNVDFAREWEARSSKDRYRGTDPFVLAVGEQALVAINSRDGSIVRTVHLESPPVAPALIADFNGDGTNDVIIVSAAAIYGFVVHSTGATTTVAMMMMLVVAILVLLFVAREASLRESTLGATVAAGGFTAAEEPEFADAELPTTNASAARPRRVKRSTD